IGDQGIAEPRGFLQLVAGKHDAIVRGSKSHRSSEYPRCFLHPGDASMSEIDLAQFQVRVRTTDQSQDRRQQILDGVRTALERRIVWVEEQARRLDPDVEIDPYSVHGESGDSRHRSQTVRQAAVRHEQVGNRSPGLAVLARVHADQWILTAAFGLHQYPDEL